MNEQRTLDSKLASPKKSSGKKFKSYLARNRYKDSSQKNATLESQTQTHDTNTSRLPHIKRNSMAQYGEI